LDVWLATSLAAAWLASTWFEKTSPGAGPPLAPPMRSETTGASSSPQSFSVKLF
jgi:hypothetical protein